MLNDQKDTHKTFKLWNTCPTHTPPTKENCLFCNDCKSHECTCTPEQPRLSKIQEKALKHRCPNCKVGKLHEVDGETEQYLWCNKCDLSMDSSGGYTC